MNNIGFGLSNGVYAERFDDGEIYVAVVRVRKNGQNIFFDKEYRKDGYWVDRSFTDDKMGGWRPATPDEIREFMQKMQKSGVSSKGRMNESDAGQNLTLGQFSKWLGFKPFDVSLAINTVRDSDPDGAKTVLEDMGYDEAAEAVEAIYSVYGSLKAAKEVCKEELGIINENKKKLETFVRTIIKESDDTWASDGGYYTKRTYEHKLNPQERQRIEHFINEFKSEVLNLQKYPEEHTISVHRRRNYDEQSTIFSNIISYLQERYNVIFDNESEGSYVYFWLENQKDFNVVYSALDDLMNNYLSDTEIQNLFSIE